MDVIVIGGSAAGLKAACRIARLQPDARVRVLVKDEYFGYSVCGLPYYLSGDVDDHRALATAPNGTLKDERYFREVKGVEVLPRHEAVAIDRAARVVHCRVGGGREATFPYDKLVIATGTRPLMPALPGRESPGVTHFTSLPDAIKLRQDLERGRVEKVAILGAGFIGLELVEAFRGLWGVDVELVEFQPQVLSGMVDVELARLVEAELVDNGVHLQVGCGCREIIHEDDKLCIFDRAGNMIQADRMVLTSGVKPNVELARTAGLEIGVTGGVKVDKYLRTSDPDIFAAGDCVELPNSVDGAPKFWSLGSMATRMGRVAGDNVCNGDTRLEPVVGATILKVFELNVGAVGLTAAECHERGYEVDGSWGTFHDRLHYYPGAVPVHLRLIADRGSSMVLGLQAVSKGNIQHYLDTAAQLIRMRGSLDEFASVEHAYAPPYAQPLSPLHYLAYIADNSKSAGIKLVPPAEFQSLPAGTVILDVRTEAERTEHPIEAAGCRMVTIQLEELRGRLSEVPADMPIVAMCQMGGRAWDAALMLRRAGWKEVGILAGGVLFQAKNSRIPADKVNNGGD